MLCRMLCRDTQTGKKPPEKKKKKRKMYTHGRLKQESSLSLEFKDNLGSIVRVSQSSK